MDTTGALYFDASALVKLIANEASEALGQVAVRQFYYNHANRYATSFCVAETFSVFKLKYLRHEIDRATYIKYVQGFIRTVIGVSLQLDEVSILSPTLFREAEQLINKYGIDFIDCCQIVTILHGKFSECGPISKSLLVTADRDLAKAARGEGARVWEITSEAVPA